MNNKEFSTSNELFRTACDLAQVAPTPRQASKFRRRMGRAFIIGGNEAKKLLAEREADRERRNHNHHKDQAA